MLILYQVLIRNLVSESLPNILGYATDSVTSYSSQRSGAISVNIDDTTHRASADNTSLLFVNAELSFNASWSNSIYKDNAHVVPNSIKCTFYIRY